VKSVKGHLYLSIRGGTFYFRRRVPTDCRDAFPQGEFYTVSLKTTSLQEARKRLARHVVQFDEIVERARTSPPPAGSSADTANQGPSYSREAVKLKLHSWLLEQLNDGDWEVPDATDLMGWTETSDRSDEELVNAALEAQVDRAERELRTGAFGPTVLAHASVLLSSLGAPEFAADHRSKDFRFAVREVALTRLELAKQRHALLGGSGKVVFNTSRFGDEALDRLQRATSITLREAGEEYLRRKSPSQAVSTRENYARKFELFYDCLGGDLPVADITRKQLSEMRDSVLRQLPASFRLRYPDKSPEEAVALGRKDGAPTLAAKTINSHIDLLASFFEFCVVEEYIPRTPAKKLQIEIGDEDTLQVASFSTEQLTEIFKQPVFEGCLNDDRGYATPGPNRPRRHRYWIPIIALFSGMRLREICQLRARDVRREDGVYVFDVTEKVKTKSSIRIVPVHAQLIKLGLVDYADCLPNDGWLFPDLPRGVSENPVDPFSKWFARLLDHASLCDKEYRFHSFRHTWRTALRDAGVSAEVVKRMGGWKETEVQASYGESARASVLAAEINKIRFGIDLG